MFAIGPLVLRESVGRTAIGLSAECSIRSFFPQDANDVLSDAVCEISSSNPVAPNSVCILLRKMAKRFLRLVERTGVSG